MSDIICVTNRTLCRDAFLTRMHRIIKARPRAVILREKDLEDAAYERLARALLPVCAAEGVPLVLSGRLALAEKLQLATQLPAHAAKAGEGICFGASVHSAAEAALLQASSAQWLIAGHVWETDCKAGMKGRGTDFLRAVVAASAVPVYAIGGVTPARMSAVYAAGAAGACVMSALMQCDDPAMYLKQFEHQSGKEERL